jgi:protein SCO1/2
MVSIQGHGMRQFVRWVLAPVAMTWLAVAMAAAFGSAEVRADDRRPGADRFPNVTFITQYGKPVRLYDDLIKGKTVVINLIYTTCQYACPLETAKLAQVQRLLGDRMGRDIFFLSITIDPEHDTPAVLKEYADKYHAGPGWLFLTGKKEEIELVSKTLGLYTPPDPARNPDGHMPYLLVGNEATGQWMRNSALDNPAFMARTIGDWLNSWQAPRREAQTSYADAPRFALTHGEYKFATHCAACHTIGRGDLIGPDLRGVAAARDRAWLARFIVEPDKMLREGDARAVALRAKYKQVRMPNLNLTKQDAAAIIEYLDQRSRSVSVSRGAAAAPAAVSHAPVASRTSRAGVNLQPVLTPYLRIQQALHVDRITGVASAARAIVAEAGKLGAGSEPIRRAASQLEQATDVSAARQAFGLLSDAIIARAEAGASVGSEVKMAYCPMAQKYWLQTGETVQNPFYGQSMGTCGRIVARR